MDRRGAERDLEDDAGDSDRDPDGGDEWAATISNTCVAPPVGNGSAGTPSNSTNRIAKLFSPNASTRLPSVFSPSPVSHRSSSSLSRCRSAVAVI